MGVAVGIEDELFARRGETGAQRTPVTAVRLVMDDAHFRIDPGELAEDAGGAVLAAVVDDNDLVVGRQSARRENGGDDHARDGPAVVVRRKEDGKPGRWMRARGHVENA